MCTFCALFFSGEAFFWPFLNFDEMAKKYPVKLSRGIVVNWFENRYRYSSSSSEAVFGLFVKMNTAAQYIYAALMQATGDMYRLTHSKINKFIVQQAKKNMTPVSFH
jgi:hypothetical protein